MVLGVDPVPNGQRGQPAGLYVVYGMQDPTVVPTAGLPGMIFIRIAPALDPAAPVALYQKHTTDDMDTNWVEIGSGGSMDDFDFKAPVDTVNAFGTNINLAAPGAVINGVTMAAGMSFLAEAQTISSENGIYTWNGAAVPATRRSDADTSAKVTHGMFTWVDGNTGNLPTTRNLTGWILQTPDPIVLNTTNLVFVQAPINASAATRIASTYWVSGLNGSDTAPSTRGSIAAPFLTIQAAINQAVAEGKTNINPANIIVVPRPGPYPSFTTAPGISVQGLAHNDFQVFVTSVVIAPDGAGANSNTGSCLSNLHFTGAGTLNPCVSFTGANQGRWSLKNCTIGSASANHSILFNSPGSVLNLDSCFVRQNASIVGYNAIEHLAGGNLAMRNCRVEGVEKALRVAAGAVWNAQDSQFSSTGAFYAIDNGGICQSMMNCQIINNTGLAGALVMRAGSVGYVFNCATYVNGGFANYEVELGAVLAKRNIVFAGSTYNVIVAGTVNTLEDSEELVVFAHTVTVPEAGAKNFDLPKTPINTNIGVSFEGDSNQEYGVDFSVIGYTLTWAALGLDLMPVAAGDKFIVTYIGSPRN